MNPDKDKPWPRWCTGSIEDCGSSEGGSIPPLGPIFHLIIAYANFFDLVFDVFSNEFNELANSREPQPFIFGWT